MLHIMRFVKSVLIILIVITLVLIPFTLILSHQFTKYASDEINRFNQDKVVQTANNLDFFLTNLKVFGINIYEDQRIQNWLMAKKQDLEAQQIAENTMGLYLTTQPFIHKSYLINFRSESVLDSVKGQIRFRDFSDQQILLNIRNHQQSFLRYFNHTADGQSYLALIYPSTPSRKDYYGYLVLLLNKEMIETRLLSNNLPNTVNFVTDMEGNVLLGNADIRDRATWTPSSAIVGSQEWTLYSYNELNTLRRHVGTFQNQIVWNCLGLLGLLVFIAAWYAIRAYRPIAKLYKMIQGRMERNLTGQPNETILSRHEMKYIQYSVELLLDSVDKMNQEMSKHRDLIREEALRQWILQGKLTHAIKNTIETESKLTQYLHLYMAVIRVESYQAFGERYNFYSRKLLKFAMGNIAAEIIRKEGWEAECVDLGTDHLIVLIGRHEETEADYIPVIRNVGEQINGWLKIPNVLASSRAIRPDDDLRSVYDNVLELTMLKFVSGEPKVYLPDDLERFVQVYQPLDADVMLENIINAVRLGNVKQLEDNLNLLFRHIQPLTHEKRKLHLMFVTYTLFKAFSKLEIVQNIDNLMQFLESFNTLQQYRSWLERIIQDIWNSINVPLGSGRKGELAAEIAQYVKDNLQDPMLTQEQIAGHLSLSYSYVRSVFKEVYSVTLADFILDERIRFVKEMLVETKYTIPDIAEKAGFQSRSYFFTVFKKVTGMTPNEFRLLQRGAVKGEVGLNGEL